jgi:hypothetical protein
MRRVIPDIQDRAYKILPSPGIDDAMTGFSKLRGHRRLRITEENQRRP